jgi:ribonuclease HI
MYHLYTDGACKGNPGQGGWAFLLLLDEDPGDGIQASGSEAKTTNNRMEMLAVIEGLRFIPMGSEVKIGTDSRYVIVTIESKTPIHKLANADLVVMARELLAKVTYTFEHVKGHSGHPQNELVDKMASDAAKAQIRSHL